MRFCPRAPPYNRRAGGPAGIYGSARPVVLPLRLARFGVSPEPAAAAHGPGLLAPPKSCTAEARPLPHTSTPLSPPKSCSSTIHPCHPDSDSDPPHSYRTPHAPTAGGWREAAAREGSRKRARAAASERARSERPCARAASFGRPAGPGPTRLAGWITGRITDPRAAGAGRRLPHHPMRSTVSGPSTWIARIPHASPPSAPPSTHPSGSALARARGGPGPRPWLPSPRAHPGPRSGAALAGRMRRARRRSESRHEPRLPGPQAAAPSRADRFPVTAPRRGRRPGPAFPALGGRSLMREEERLNIRRMEGPHGCQLKIRSPS